MCIRDSTRDGNCRLRRAYKAHGGRHKVERMLKWWVLQAPLCVHRTDHLKMQFPVFPLGLPSMEELDTMPFAIPVAEDAAEAAPAAKAAASGRKRRKVT